jgi:hypothetical protein
MALDIQALKTKLREYDTSLPKCPKRIVVVRFDGPDGVLPGPHGWSSLQSTEHRPCCLPEGHDGECRNSRLVLGWPGYEVLKELIEIAEKKS